MKTPLEDYDTWLEIEYSEAPEKIKEIAKHIHALSWKVKLLRYGYRRSVEAVFESQEILSVIISDFSSLFQHSAELLKKKDEQEVKKIQNDLINMGKEIKASTVNLTFRPENKLIPAVFPHIKGLIAEPINSLIGLVLIDAWRNSEKKVYRTVNVGSFVKRYKQKEFISCDENKFYETIYTETLRKAFQHPLLTVFRSPIKTIASPIISPAELRNQILGVYQEIKTAEKTKEEPSNMQIPEELTEKAKEEPENEPKEVLSKEVFSEEESDEDEEEIEEDEG